MMELSKESIMYLVNNLANEFNAEVTCDEVSNNRGFSNICIFTIKDVRINLHNDPYSDTLFYIGDFHSIDELLEAMKAEAKKKMDKSKINERQ